MPVACAIGAGHARPAGAQTRAHPTVRLDAGPVWFEESAVFARVSPDGRWAGYRALQFHLYDLQTGLESVEPIWPGLDTVQAASFAPGGEIFLRGRLGAEAGWFRRTSSGPARMALPLDAAPEWSADGSRVAYFRRGMVDSGLVAGPPDHVRAYRLPGTVTGVAWLASTDTVVAAAMDTTGLSALYKVDVVSGQWIAVARDLDAATPSPIAVTPDGRRAFIALASAGKPRNEARHRPLADRWLRVFEINLSNGTLRAVTRPERGIDLLGPAVANGRLYWTRSETRSSVVRLPIGGGPVQMVMEHAAVPSWRPGGKQIGFYYGDWRRADWAINWDAGAVSLDARGRPIGPYIPVITNFGEDFEPEWSPNGRWIAYHSHRSATPVPYYGAAGSSDDIWLRRIGRPPRDTADIRLTDFGWETGSPTWSRDGTRLVFASYDRQGAPGVSPLWLVTIDTVTGRPLSHARVPLPPGVTSVSWAAWSPVRDEIAIESEDDGGRHSLWVMGSDATAARKVVDYPMRTYGGIAWTPDGKTLVYSALVDRYNQLFAVSASGGAPRQLTDGTAQILHPSVSPNGKTIAATRLEHKKSIVSIPLPR